MPSKLCVGLALFASVFTFPSAAWAAVTFAPAVNYGTGTKPASVAVGDLNGDSRPDLVTANSTSNNVSVLIGNGNGTFAAAANYAVGAGPTSVAVGDFNADNKPDLVTANANTGADSVSVLLGNGNGTFAAAVQYPVGSKPYAVAVGDVNGDGKLDLVTANSGTTTVSVVLGNGDGTFGTQTAFGGGAGAFAIALGDLNGDSKLDLITANPLSTRLFVFLGNGDGSFGTPDTPYGGDYPLSLAFGDLNGDAKLDLVVANVSNNTVGVFIGNGAGGFTGPAHYAAGDGPVGVAISDLDGDGKPDVVVADRRGDSISMLAGNGDGTFAPATSHPVGDGALAVAIADLDGDGRRDVATANVDGNNASVLLNTTALTFTTGPTATISGSAVQGETLTADEGAPDPVQDSFTYEWFADGVTIGGATAKTIEMTSAQVGKKISVTVTAKKAGFTDASDTSPETATVVGIFAPGPTATITGTARQGQTLTAGEGTPGPTQDSFTYEWFTDGVTIGGATAKTLLLTSAQVGKKISVTVTAKKAGYSDASDTSAETVPVVGIFTPGPTATISGFARSGSTLTARAGSPSPTPSSLAYRWYADGVKLSQVNKTFKPTSSHRGKRITVRVYALKPGYLTASDLSPATARVSKLAAKTISMELNDYTLRRGQSVRAEIELLAPGEPFSIVLDGRKLTSGTANAKGIAVKYFTVPATATLGERILRAYGAFPDRTDPDKIIVR